MFYEEKVQRQLRLTARKDKKKVAATAFQNMKVSDQRAHNLFKGFAQEDKIMCWNHYIIFISSVCVFSFLCIWCYFLLNPWNTACEFLAQLSSMILKMHQSWADKEKQRDTAYLKYEVILDFERHWILVSWLNLVHITVRIGLIEQKWDVKVGKVISGGKNPIQQFSLSNQPERVPRTSFPCWVSSVTGAWQSSAA